jgi:hypothetical protein
LTSIELRALRFLKERVLTAPPTKVQPTSLQTWIIFSDGACEGELEKDGTVGAVLVSPEGVVCRYFSERVPQQWMEWFLTTTKHPIFELELLPVWVALCTWEQLVQNSQCIFYIDNEAAKGPLINGATSTPCGKQLIQEFVIREMHLQVKVWFSRVPTASNIADKPSRLDTDELDALGVFRDPVDWQFLWSKLESMGTEDWGFKDGIPWTFPDAL